MEMFEGGIERRAVIRGSKKSSSLVTAKAQARRERVSVVNERIGPYYRAHRRKERMLHTGRYS
jgi:hypothetical protein